MKLFHLNAMDVCDATLCISFIKALSVFSFPFSFLAHRVYQCVYVKRSLNFSTDGHSSICIKYKSTSISHKQRMHVERVSFYIKSTVYMMRPYF